MREFGYEERNSNHTLFLKQKQGKLTTLIVYVDDMVVREKCPRRMKSDIGLFVLGI